MILKLKIFNSKQILNITFKSSIKDKTSEKPENYGINTGFSLFVGEMLSQLPFLAMLLWYLSYICSM
jgi:hypothetical protein